MTTHNWNPGTYELLESADRQCHTHTHTHTKPFMVSIDTF